LESLAATVVTGATAFAATNLDDLVLLAAFFSDRAYRARSVVAGQYAGIAILYAASVAAALAAWVIPQGYVVFLGLLPIAIGLKKLHDGAAALPDAPGSASMAGVAAVTVANGGDNIAVYVPLFATRAFDQVLTIGAVFSVMTALWCYCAFRLVSHPEWGRAIRAQGERWLPYMLIALGLWILSGF
jgi:cadmium resistance protein CadD (predicted permease)